MFPLPTQPRVQEASVSSVCRQETTQITESRAWWCERWFVGVEEVKSRVRKVKDVITIL